MLDSLKNEHEAKFEAGFAKLVNAISVFVNTTWDTQEQLEIERAKLVGKHGMLTEILVPLKDCSPEYRIRRGQQLNMIVKCVGLAKYRK